MKICIPTYKRVDSQITLSLIPKILYPDTYLVCNKFEEEDLKKYNINLIVLPDDIKGIGNVRQYVVDNLDSKYIWFIDDDLSFLRRESNSIKLNKIKDEDFLELYNSNKTRLEKGYAIVGCSAQGGNNRFEGKFTYFGRIFSVYAINTEFAHNQKASNQSGGCSESGRTYEVQKRSALLLAEKHKPFVNVVKKESKNWVGMEHRYDVKIFWKKAFEQGRYIK